MRMHNQITKLIETAVVDKEIDQLLHKKSRIPQIIAEVRHQIATLEQRLNENRQRIEEASHQKRDKEGELADKRAWIEQREGKLKEIKTNKEYHAALKEIEEAKKFISQTEDAILTLLALIEAESPKSTAATEEISTQVSGLAHEIQDREAELTKIDGFVSELEQKRIQIETSIDQPLLRKYKHIKKKVSPAIALIQEDTCMECHTRIPPQVSIEILKMETIVTCPRCYRILYRNKPDEPGNS